MLKKLLTALALLSVAICFAAVDVNKGTAAELDGVKGIGPAKSAQILSERKKGDFKDWKDFISRVSGIGEKSAAHLSEAGLTVNGKPFQASAPAKKGEKVEKAEKADKADTSGKPAPADAKKK